MGRKKLVVKQEENKQQMEKSRSQIIHFIQKDKFSNLKAQERRQSSDYSNNQIETHNSENNKFMAGNDDLKARKQHWTEEEDLLLYELVRKFGAQKWTFIAQNMIGRIGKQCRERWHNHLNPDINKEPWSDDEEWVLFLSHQLKGNKWAEITQLLLGRTDNAIKNHWNSSMKKRIPELLRRLSKFSSEDNIQNLQFIRNPPYKETEYVIIQQLLSQGCSHSQHQYLEMATQYTKKRKFSTRQDFDSQKLNQTMIVNTKLQLENSLQNKSRRGRRPKLPVSEKDFHQSPEKKLTQIQTLNQENIQFSFNMSYPVHTWQTPEKAIKTNTHEMVRTSHFSSNYMETQPDSFLMQNFVSQSKENMNPNRCSINLTTTPNNGRCFSPSHFLNNTPKYKLDTHKFQDSLHQFSNHKLPDMSPHQLFCQRQDYQQSSSKKQYEDGSII